MHDEFEWDEAKRETVLRERNLDFLRLAYAIFDGRPTLTKLSPRGVETRFVTLGAVDDLIFAVVWTRRNEIKRLITARRARDDEKIEYRALFL